MKQWEDATDFLTQVRQLPPSLLQLKFLANMQLRFAQHCKSFMSISATCQASLNSAVTL